MDVKNDVRSPDTQTIYSWDKISQAFNKVKDNFKLSGGHLELVPKDRYVEIIDFIADHFMKDEPLFSAFGVELSAYTDRLLWRLRANISIMVVEENTNRIIGVFLSDISKKDVTLDPNTICDDSMRALFTFVKQKDVYREMYDMNGVSELFHLANLAVHRDYRRQGLGFTLFGSSLALAREIGIKGVYGEGTSNFSQKLFEKFGFRTLLELPYSQYEYKGSYLSEQSGEHTSLKIYLLIF